MKLSIFKKLLNRYNQQEANEAEAGLVDSWYESFGSSQDIEPLNQKGKKRELRNLMYTEIAKKIDAQPVIRLSPVFYLKIAAMLAVVCGITLFCYYSFFRPVQISNKSIYVSAGTGTMKKLILPDSSELWLNAGSRIHYNQAFTAGKFRTVALDHGEVFFNVKPNKAKPFLVRTGILQTRVLGTSFNIRSYQEISEIKVTVLTGKVQVNDKKRMLGVLLPGQEIIYHKKNHSVTTAHVNAGLSNSWINGDTYLRQAEFTELALVFKNRYHINLKAGNARIEAYRYSILLDQHTPIENTIKAICSIHQSKYRRHGDDIVIY